MNQPAPKRKLEPVHKPGTSGLSFLERLATDIVVDLTTAAIKVAGRMAMQHLSQYFSASYSASRNSNPVAFKAFYRWADHSGMFTASSRHAQLAAYEEDLGPDSITVEAIDGRYIKYKEDCLIVINLDRVEPANEKRWSPGGRPPQDRVLDIKIYGRDGNRFEKELKAITLDLITSDKTRVFNLEDPWRTQLRDLRGLESVVLKDEIREEIVSHLEWWKDAKEMHARFGIPYKTGILLHGPPGTGKTSLAQAVASYLKFDLAVVRVNPKEMADLKNQISGAKPKTVLLIEDVDRSITIPGTSESVPKALEGLLEKPKKDEDDEDETPERAIPGIEHLMNALDGVTSPEGVVIIMTTNHRDRIDPALIRPGRVNLEILLDMFDWDRAVKLGKRFEVPEEIVAGFGEEVWSVPADLQQRLMQYVSKRDREAGDK